MRKCIKCGKLLPLSKFYPSYSSSKSGKKYYRTECKSCFNKLIFRDYQKERRFINKKYFVEKFGNCCDICGYSRSINALEFHHIDKQSKEYKISDLFQTVSNKDKISKELKKCVLLCSNCHRELHFTKNNSLATSLMSNSTIT